MLPRLPRIAYRTCQFPSKSRKLVKVSSRSFQDSVCCSVHVFRLKVSLGEILSDFVGAHVYYVLTPHALELAATTRTSTTSCWQRPPTTAPTSSYFAHVYRLISRLTKPPLAIHFNVCALMTRHSPTTFTLLLSLRGWPVRTPQVQPQPFDRHRRG